MRLAWLTDIHLDFVSEPARATFIQRIRNSKADAVMIGGDIAVAATFAHELKNLQASIECPIFFVLGNHDYFGGSIEAVRQQARQLADATESTVQWLPDAGAVRVGENTALIGHGGWGDGRAGLFFESKLVLHDYLKIADLSEVFDERQHKGKLPESLFDKLNALGDEAAKSISQSLKEAMQLADHVMLLMHVPPFRDACWYKGRLSDDNWAPHFVCQAVGEVLVTEMQQQPEKQLTVLCGHTHGAGTSNILPNLQVVTGAAEYGKPAVQNVFEI